MTVAELEAKLTAMLGSNGAGVSGAMLDSAIDSALDDLARFKPKVQYEAVQLVAGTNAYDVPEDTYNVLDAVFPDIDARQLAMLEAPELSTFHSHSLTLIIAQKWEMFSSSLGYDWEYDIDAMQVLLTPTPRNGSMMGLKLAKRRTLEEVPASLQKPIEDLALAEALRSLAMSVGGGITSVPIGIGTVSFNPASLTQQADVLRAGALKRLGTASGGGAVLIG